MHTELGNSRTMNFACLAVVLAVALLFAGSRPLWEPDESRYTTVAMVMLQTGDYLHPARHPDVPHWTKPPLTYWTIAAGMGMFGTDEMAARLPAILGFLITALATLAIARRLRLRQSALPLLVLCAMPLLIGGANYISTDMLLTGLVSLGWFCFIRALTDESGQSVRFMLLMWLCFSLAFLTKGPPALLFMLPVFVSSRIKTLPQVSFHWLAGIAIFIVFGLGWYLWVVIEDPELLSYFLWQETVLRSLSDHSGRSAEWYGAFKVYLPTILLGTLPWLYPLVRGVRQCWQNRKSDPYSRLLLWWLLLPLVVFFISRSRMPFYLLPLCVPAAIIISRYLDSRPLKRLILVAVLIWTVALCSLRAHPWFSEQVKNPATLAGQLQEICPGPVDEVLFFEMHPMMGLSFYLDTQIKLVQFADLESELNSTDPMHGRIWLVREDISQQFANRSALYGHRLQLQQTIRHHRSYNLYLESNGPACRAAQNH